MGAYERLFRPLVFLLEPERAQALAEWVLRRRWLWRIAAGHYDYQDPRLQVEAAGLRFPSPVGLAAGYDKHCEVLDSLLALGFGYVVGGTVLPQPRPGNPRPRVMRLPGRESLINALGFPSKGLEAARQNLRHLRDAGAARGKPLIVSIAGLNIEDFLACHAALEPLADAIELNVSSPNTQGLRVFQEPDTFHDLLERLNSQRTKPVFVKIPPYSANEERGLSLALVRIAKEGGVDGLTVANTRPIEAPQLAMKRGGLSGRALLEDTLRMVADVRKEVGKGMAINACGGISSAEDALRALQAGANTVQLLTAMVYQGPGVAMTVNRGLVRMLDERNCNSLHALAEMARPT